MATGDSSKNRRNRQEIKLRDDLVQIEAQMRRWAGASIERIEKDQEIYDADLGARDQVVGRALHFGLTDHPFVQAWLSEKRTFGEWDDLRRSRAGLQSGVKRPMSKEDFWVAYHACHLYEKGKKPEGIRRELCRILRLKKPEAIFGLTKEEMKQLAKKLSAMPRQNFHRWLKRLNVIE